MTDKRASRISDTDIAQAQAISVAKIAVERGLVLQKVGGELIGPCPHCGGRDRFAINVANLFNCRGCGGKGGGAASFLMWLDGVGFREAVEVLVGGRSAPVRRTNVANKSDVHSDRRQPNFLDNKNDVQEVRRQKARWLWSHRQPITGSIAERYLREVRGIDCPLPPTLAFLPPSKPEHHPALIAAFGLCDEIEAHRYIVTMRNIVAVHLTLLKPDGSGKIDQGVMNTLKSNKLMIGSPSGTPIILAPPNDLLGLAVTEGIEDALSVHQATGLGTWAAGAAGFLPKLADVVPDWIECVTIFAHADKAGQDGARKLSAKLRTRNIEATIEGLAS